MARRYAILRQVIEAWQAKDVEAVLSHLADDIVWHYAAPALPPVRGKATARKLLQRFGADMHGIQWRIFAHAEAGDRLFIEGVDDYRTNIIVFFNDEMSSFGAPRTYGVEVSAPF